MIRSGRWQYPLVHLRLDLDALVGRIFLKPRHFDFVVEMADVADDGLVLHVVHVIAGDDVVVAGAGDENVAFLHGVFHRGHFKAFHRGLKSADGGRFRSRAHGHRSRAWNGRSPCPRRHTRQ